MRLAADIETDGLLRDLTKIHCIAAIDIDSGEEFTFGPEAIKPGLKLLQDADELWFHNGIGFDLEAIYKLYPRWKAKGQIWDTLIMSRMLFTDMLDRDFRARAANMPANLYGRHSLESWGHRLGVHKSEFGKNLDGDWSTYTPEMLDYCLQDVVVTVAVAKLFGKKLSEYANSLRTEHEIATIMAWQEREGYPFDEEAAHKLESELRGELETLSDQMRSTFTYVAGTEYTPKVNNKTRGYFKGAPMTRLNEFNPTSRAHIAWAFETHRGWEPLERTEQGKPRVDESVLEALGTEESKAFARILQLQKWLGQLSEGKNAWLRNVTQEGRLHHSCVLATNTGRMAHMRPNLAQVPSDHRFRQLFIPGPGRLQVGADASGLELRCLSHYLHPFEGGRFGEEVVQGDIHTHLASIYGTDRKTGKGVTYCLIYGGGNVKLGLTAGASKSNAAQVGKTIRKKVLTGLQGFADLSSAVAKRAESGVLRGLDGRPIRLLGKTHVGLNYLLQSAGAIICKRWVLRANELLQEAGIDYWPLAFVHDEMQMSVREDQAEQAAFLITAAMKDVQQELNFRCELDSEAQIGNSWADCH